MEKAGFLKRFILPLTLVVGINLVSGWIYDTAAMMDTGTLRSLLINLFAPLLFISLWFFAFVGPPLSYFLGATFRERLVIAFANPVIWVVSVEAKIACQFCTAEMIYFLFLPWTFGVICVTCIEFSVADLVCRFWHRRRGADDVTVFHPGVLTLLLVGLTGTYAGLIKGQEWVYFIVQLYKTHFLS
jgi:hypothetical protein